MSDEDRTQIYIFGGDLHFGYLMRRYTRRIAHQISIKNSNDVLIDSLELIRPDAIIIELSFYETDGWSTLYKLKGCPNTKEIPVLVCSWQDDKIKAIEAGADFFLRMPILFHDFANVIRSIGLPIKHNEI